LSIAVLINRSALAASLGDKPALEAIDRQVKEIEALVASAAGLRKERGDSVKISIVDFVDSAHDLEPVAGPTFLELALRQSGSLVNAGAGIAVAAMAIWFVVRPATRALLAAPPAATQAAPALAAIGAARALPSQNAAAGPDANFLIEAKDERDEFLEALAARKDKSPQRHLQRLVDFDEEHAAAILKQWIRQGASA
jgi:flagellar M-ring protein FliF